MKEESGKGKSKREIKRGREREEREENGSILRKAASIYPLTLDDPSEHFTTS